LAQALLIGIAVISGSGKKSSRSLQVIAAVLYMAAFVGGDYLALNEWMNPSARRFTSWTAPGQFLRAYGWFLIYGPWDRVLYGLGGTLISAVLPTPTRLRRY
jgi:hypothetical protein